MDLITNTTTADIVGYLASLFIILSFIFSNIKTIRIINAIGCVCFVVYAYAYQAWPVLIPNAILLFVQLYYIIFKPGK